ncbi:MAG: cardiolipin synthase [Firmicutes bacterium]|nr:cardiolipin synthase [Bacillota bacterium]
MRDKREYNNSSSSAGMRLLRKGQKGFFRVIFSRVGIMTAMLFLQIGILISIVLWLDDFLPHAFGGFTLMGVIMVLYLISSDHNPSGKITWLIIILVMPVFGIALYAFIESDLGHRKLRDALSVIIAKTERLIPQDREVLEKLHKKSYGAASLAHYLRYSGGFPVYDDSDITYLSSGEEKFKELLKQLEAAEHFIFLEYFIIDEGLMWGKVLEILARKAKEGVDVRVMYDGSCEFSTLPRDYPKRLARLGIKCKVFAPVSPFVSTYYNYRDHRKILVIDGHTAFTGGINLADEYINRIKRFGHWKDTAVMIKGSAVKTFTLLFLQNWSMDANSPDFDKFLTYNPLPSKEAKGFVIPYGDCPVDNDKTGERVYMDILNRSLDYVHIMTPYLILDGELETALKFAAERGVDVKIILPGIPDKKIPYALAKTHYKSLINSGVKIYEYTPGFVHAKVVVADAIEAVVGTINMDYRSLYHHFECAAYMYDTDCIEDIENDFNETMSKCKRVTEETIKKEKLYYKITGFILKGFAPLM